MTTPPNDPNDPEQSPQQPPAYPGDIPNFPPDAGFAGASAAPEPPATILNAVKLMYVGAALSALGAIFGLFGTNKEDIADQDSSLTASEVDAAYTAGLIFAVVFGAIAVGLWIWMAVMNRNGRSWARIVATVLGGLNILFTLIGLSVTTGLATVLNVLTIVLAGAIIWLLYRPDSNNYYQSVTQFAKWQ